MPNRIIKESICTSDTIDQMSWFEECFWHRLIVNCDDYGRFDARPAVLIIKAFPAQGADHPERCRECADEVGGYRLRCPL